MSDYFEGLAARGSGAATALRPRLSSAYETREAAQVVEEVQATAAIPVVTLAASGAPEQPAAADPLERVVVRDVVLTREESSERRPAMVLDQRVDQRGEQRVDQRGEQRVEHVRDHTHEQTQREETIAGETIEGVQDLAAAPHSRERRPDSHLRSNPLIEPAGHRPESLPPRRPQPPLPHPHAPLGRHQPLTIRQAPSVGGQPSIDRQPQPDPVVHITIGRVEVRAIQPAQPAPRPAPAAVPQGPTLAEFLEQRERRK